MAKKTKRVSVTPDNVGRYLSKASEYMRTSFAAIANEDYHAACLKAVHAVIMANDAITAFHGGKRSSSEDHRDAPNLLREIAPLSAVPCIYYLVPCPFLIPYPFHPLHPC